SRRSTRPRRPRTARSRSPRTFTRPPARIAVMTTSRPSRFISELALLALAGCAPADDVATDAGGDAGVFVAVASDFKCYDSWQKFDLAAGDGGVADDAGCAHVADVPRVAYINKLPAHGSTSFPVGTIIVKEIHTTA